VSGTPFSDRKWPRADIKFPEVGALAIPLYIGFQCEVQSPITNAHAQQEKHFLFNFLLAFPVDLDAIIIKLLNLIVHTTVGARDLQ